MPLMLGPELLLTGVFLGGLLVLLTYGLAWSHTLGGYQRQFLKVSVPLCSGGMLIIILAQDPAATVPVQVLTGLVTILLYVTSVRRAMRRGLQPPEMRAESDQAGYARELRNIEDGLSELPSHDTESANDLAHDLGHAESK